MNKCNILLAIGIFMAWGCQNTSNTSGADDGTVSATITDMEGRVFKVTKLEAIYMEEKLLYMDQSGNKKHDYKYFRDDKLHVMAKMKEGLGTITEEIIIPFSEIKEISFGWTSSYWITTQVYILLKDQTKIEAIMDSVTTEWSYIKIDKDSNILEEYTYEDFYISMTDYRYLNRFDAKLSGQRGRKAKRSFYLNYEDGPRSIRFDD